MRRLLATAVLLGAIIATAFGAFVAQPAAAAEPTEIEIVTDSADPELSASHGSQTESAVVATFVILLIAASAVGPWLARTAAAEFDRRMQPLPVRSDESLIRRQY